MNTKVWSSAPDMHLARGDIEGKFRTETVHEGLYIYNTHIII